LDDRYEALGRAPDGAVALHLLARLRSQIPIQRLDATVERLAVVVRGEGQ
jgi:hypothetical protein